MDVYITFMVTYNKRLCTLLWEMMRLTSSSDMTSWLSWLPISSITCIIAGCSVWSSCRLWARSRRVWISRVGILCVICWSSGGLCSCPVWSICRGGGCCGCCPIVSWVRSAKNICTKACKNGIFDQIPTVQDKSLILYCFQASYFQFSVMQMYSKELLPILKQHKQW